MPLNEIEPRPEPNPFLQRPVSLLNEFSDDYTAEVTPQRFPSLFADNNGLRARYLQAGKLPTTSLFTLIFSEKSNPLLQVLKIPATDVTLDQVGEAANLRIFPATEIVTIDKKRDIPRIRAENEIGLRDITGWVEHQAYGGKSIPISYYGRQIVERDNRFYVLSGDVYYFNQTVASQTQDPLPDMAHGKAGRKDVSILQYAIFHAILGSKFMDMKTIAGPKELCNILGLQDPSRITEELYNAVSAQRIGQLTAKGILPPGDLPQYLENAAEWMFKTADYTNRKRALGSAFSFPYLINRQRHHGVKPEGNPPVAFLPFLYDAYLKFLSECPGYPQEGEYLMHDALLSHLNLLNQFSTGLLLASTPIDLTAKDAEILIYIHDTVKRYRASFAEIMRYYKLNPVLLNKRLPQESQQPIIHSFQKFADGLRDNLAITTKSQRIDYPHKVKKGEL